MTKSEFLSALREKLYGLPREEIAERLAFYGEAIDDRIEEGLSEEDAVGALGTLDDIVFDILGEIPLGKIIKERVKPKRRLKSGTLVLLALGSPIWGSILISLLASVFAVCASLWACVLSLWASFAAVALSAPASLVFTALYFGEGSAALGVLFIAAAFILAGLAILLYFLSLRATCALAVLVKKMVLMLKRSLVGKEGKGEAK